MFCSNLSFLEALQNCRDTANSRHRRDMELRSISRRMVAKFFVKQLQSHNIQIMTLFGGSFVAVSMIGLLAAGSVVAADPTVIELTQIPCQFIESENGIDRGYATTKKADCDAINARTGEERVASSEQLVLKPGEYIFRVINRNVPYELGFWLRGDGLIDRLRLPSVSGGGLMTGETQDYEIDLTPGEYVYSCPLNTTPDNKLIVKE